MRQERVLFWIVLVGAIVILIAGLFGCATVDPPKPIVGEVRVEKVSVEVPVKCVDEADLPQRPATAVPLERDASRKRKTAGVIADATQYEAYADQLRAAMTACIQRGGKP